MDEEWTFHVEFEGDEDAWKPVMERLHDEQHWEPTYTPGTGRWRLMGSLTVKGGAPEEEVRPKVREVVTTIVEGVVEDVQPQLMGAFETTMATDTYIDWGCGESLVPEDLAGPQVSPQSNRRDP